MTENQLSILDSALDRCEDLSDQDNDFIDELFDGRMGDTLTDFENERLERIRHELNPL